MTDFVFNIAKGRVVELYNRVQTTDPANAGLKIVILASGSSLETDAVLKDKATLTAVVSGTTNEVTNTGYSRKSLAAADLTAISPNDSSDFFAVDFADQTWDTVSSGDGWGKLLVCYDPDTSNSNDDNIIPLCCFDFAITPDGSSIQATLDSSGFFKAT